jgi:hypothetical protein
MRRNIMCRKLICLIPFIFALTSAAEADLVGLWRLDETSGTIAHDGSGNGHDGTLKGGPTWVLGKIGGALAFDGFSDQANHATDPGNINWVSVDPFDVVGPGITMAAWIRPDGFDITDARIITKQKTWSSIDIWWMLSTYTDGTALRMRLKTNDGGADGGTTTMWSDPGYLEAGVWSHVAATYDASQMRLYHNGVEIMSTNKTGTIQTDPAAAVAIGNSPLGNPGGLRATFHGLIDEVRIYNSAMSEQELLGIMQGEGYPFAYGPNPADGTIHEDTWVTLSFSPGDFAVSHDVYFGDSFDDVNAGTADTFWGNQTGEFFAAGFVGYPYPDGLVPGTTYYWRIDEVNEAEPNSPWKGNVWSFTVPPRNAYAPVPADTAPFIDPAAVTLSWTAGSGAKLHIVYFGDDYETVANATDGLQLGVLTYNPGPLELEKTYYWRVDESDGTNTYVGDVWSFTTAKEGGGIKGQYYKGMNFDNLVLTRTDPQIDFSWGAAEPDPAVGIDQFSVRWTGEVEAAFTETYTFYARADDGVRLWVDGIQLVDAWVDQSATEYSGTIDLAAGNMYSIVMEMYENSGDAVAELRWSSPSTPKQLVPQAAVAPPVKANSPNPGNGATGTSLTPVLTWNPGDYAASHEVYFGMDANAVANADKSSPQYKGTKALGDESYDPGKLAWATSYYWRLDEVNNLNPDSPWVGNLWSFTTGDFLLIDDFEGYDAGENQIWYAWKDGLGYGVQGTDPYYAGNGTGSAVGDETTASYTEETIVHGGRQSMPLAYDNNKQNYANYSETELTLTAPRDWTEENVAELSIWFRGYPASTSSFVESPAGTFTMTGSGADIWYAADKFHYAFKTLTGVGSIVAQVQSVDNTDPWAKAGVMIRETLDPGSKFAAVYITPGNGCRFQARTDTDVDATSDTSVVTTQQTAITAPYWVKLERDAAANFRASYSANGSNWTAMSWNPQNIPMSSMVYVGLAVTAHNSGATCQAVFSNVTSTDNVAGQWAHQDIGIMSNDAEPLYVAVSNSAGNPAIVLNDDPAAAQIDTWTEWVIPLSAFADQGINLADADRIAIGLGTRGNVTVAGGSGKMFFDDMRLYRQREAAE